MFQEAWINAGTMTKAKLVGVILRHRVSGIICGPDEWAHFK